MIDDTAEPRRRNPGDLVVIALFAVMLLVPGVLALAGRAGADTGFIYHTEMRVPFAAPPVTTGALATGGWQRDAERQIADDFPLRRSLIEGYDLAKYSLGDVASSHVIHGRDSWLFYADEERDYHDGTYAPGDAQLARLANLYRARSEWCRQRGITYVFALVPDKSAVYAEFLPNTVRYVTTTPGERLIPLVRARGVRAIDLRSALRAAAARGEVYSKGETHWNDAGAYVAYRAIIDELRAAGVRDTIAPASLKPRVELGEGDLDRLAGIGSTVPDAVIVYDFPKRARETAVPQYAGDPIQGWFIRAAYATADPGLPKAMLFGDSFTGALRTFVAEDFSRTVVMQHSISNAVQFDRVAIEREHPRVVIEELIERALVYSDRFDP